MGETYESAGVSIDAGEAAVEAIKADVRSTYRPEVLGDIGGFGGLFRLDTASYEDPILVSSTDGVGTKAQVARMLGRLDTIGIDLVAMCVDDLVCQGAEPLFFLDYISVGRLDPAHVSQIVKGVAEGCRRAGCALIGGEMAEHAGVMATDDFDLVGFSVGVVDRKRMLDPARVTAGDVLIGLHSPGLRSNGYTLARRLMFDVAGRGLDDPAWEEPGAPSVGEVLIEPSVIYAPAIVELLSATEVHAVAHITGGGIPGNLTRVIGDDLDAVVDPNSWETPRVFTELQRIGSVDVDEMRRVFNLGVGMIVVVPGSAVDEAVALLDRHDHRPRLIGRIEEGSGRIHFEDH